MEKYSKILIGLNLILVVLNITLLAAMYSDRNSVGLSESSVALDKYKDEQLQEQNVSSAIEKLPTSNEASSQEQIAVEMNERVTEEFPTGSASEQAKANLKSAEDVVSTEHIDAANAFKNTYSEIKGKLEELLTIGNYQQES